MPRRSEANITLAREIHELLPEITACIGRLLKNGLEPDIKELAVVVPLLKEAAGRLLLPVSDE